MTLPLEVDVADVDLTALAPHLDAQLGEADLELRPLARTEVTWA
jgi:hypothetical protein